jgi:hypothetical protein
MTASSTATGDTDIQARSAPEIGTLYKLCFLADIAVQRQPREYAIP